MMGAGNIQTMKLNFGSLKLSLEASGSEGSQGQTLALNSFPTRSQQPVVAESDDDSGTHIIAAPMIGTFYVAPAPNEPAFVQVGDEVSEGQTIGIIEAMKIMNEIASDRAGTVVELIAGDGQTVEYGSALIRIEPATA